MMRTLRRRALFGYSLIRDGRFRAFAEAVRLQLWSDTTTYGLRRDLTRPFPAPDATIPLRVRLATPADTASLFDADDASISESERMIQRDRASEVAQGLPINYVAVTEDDHPCYFQSVLFADDNPTIRAIWGSLFPQLAAHQCLLEGAYTPEAFRGRRIMPAAMARISDFIDRPGVTEAITFVDFENFASLKGCVRSGYLPYCHRHVRWRFGRASTSFTSIPADTKIAGVTG